MNALKVWYRTLGVVWILVGIAILFLAIGGLIATAALSRTLDSAIVGTILEPISRGISFSLPPALTVVWIILFGAFCLLLGGGLLNLSGWARTIAVVFYFVIAAFVLGLTVFLAVWVWDLTTSLSLPSYVPLIVLAVGIVLAVLALSTGYQLSTPRAVETFLGLTTVPSSIPAVSCPTCGGKLDLGNARCPKCDGDQPRPLPKRARLIAQDGGQEYLVSTHQPTYIGRANPNYDVRLDDPTVSKEHAYVECYEGRFFLHALKDTNGTFINDRETRVRDVELCNGDTVTFGQASFRFVVE